MRETIQKSQIFGRSCNRRRLRRQQDSLSSFRSPPLSPYIWLLRFCEGPEAVAFSGSAQCRYTMKSISGKITSTKSISLSKASKVLSNFVNAETGASQAVSSYLRRASASFDELVQLHKELKASKPDRKPRKVEEESTFNEETVKHEQENEVSQRKKRKSEEIVDSAGQSSLKKKKKRRRNEGED